MTRAEQARLLVQELARIAPILDLSLLDSQLNVYGANARSSEPKCRRCGSGLQRARAKAWGVSKSTAARWISRSIAETSV